MTPVLATSRALWNRSNATLASDEVLSQILDRGSMDDWRSLFSLAAADPQLRARLHRIVLTVPLPLPRFWMAALAALGESVDLGAPVPDYFEGTSL
jgi:hypothetical protein